MKNLQKNRFVLSLVFALSAFTGQALAQQSLNGIRLQDANNHVLTISAPTGGFTANYNFRFPSAVPAAGALLYSSDGIGQNTWLPAGANGQVLSFSGGLPVWSTLSSLLSGLIEWDLTGNAILLSYNGLLGSYLGTSNNQPLVLATTSILTPQPIEFFTNNAEKMRLTSGGELGIGLTPTAGKLLHVSGTSGTSNVRLASLASATGTTGRVMFATDATGDLQDLAFPGSSGQVLSSTTAGILSWITPNVGTVTSVTLTMPAALFSSPVSGSPVTSSGTLAPTLATQSANLIFSGPSSGIAATPTFRSMVTADIPSSIITYAKIQNETNNTVLGNVSGGAAAPSEVTPAQLKTLLNLAGTNSGDVTLAGENYLSLSGQQITANPVNLSGTNVTSTLPETKGGTNQSTYTLGDMLYSSAANTLSKLAGNTVATKKFLTQTGTGVISAAPAWNAITASDVPVMIASGASHAAGLVPDPGAVAGTTRFLREDATWQIVSGMLSGLTNKGAIYATGATTATSTGAMTDGQLLIGSTAGNPALATLTGTANQIIVTNASNSITLATPQNINTAATPQFAKLGLNQVADVNASIAATQTALGTTVTDGIILQNTTASTAIATQQYSPSLSLVGTAWKSNAPAASQTAEWSLVNEPQTGAAAPTTNLVIASNINNTGYWPCATFISGVALNLALGCAYQINGVNVLNSTTLGAGILNSSLTSVGTLTSGTWNATKISEVYGGTNQSTYTTGDILYASAANTLSKLPIGTANQVLTVSGGIPSWQSNTGFARKTASVTFTSNATLTADADLTVALAANATYEFSGVIAYNGATASSDLQIAMNIPAGATIRWSVDQAGTAFSASSVTGAGGTTSAISPFHTDGTPANSQSIFISGIVMTGVTSGNIQVYEAQATSSGVNTTTVLLNSHLKATRVQ